MTRMISQAHPDHVSRPLALANGGTGAKDQKSALIALNAVPATHIGQPTGPVPLDANIKIPLIYLPDSIQGSNNDPTLSGPSKLYIGAMRKFWITNYDIDLTYTISISIGSVVVKHDIIEVTIPYDEALIGQSTTLMINGNPYVLNIRASTIFSTTPLTFYVETTHDGSVDGVYQLLGGYGDPTLHVPRIVIELYNDASYTSLNDTRHDIDVSFTETLSLSYYRMINGLNSEKAYYCRIRLEIVTLTNDLVLAGPWTNGVIDTATAPMG